MTFERIMGIYVFDEPVYQKYREAMTPILHSVGGSFGFDFKVSDVLLSKTDDLINRVFTIEFPNEAVMDSFFSNPEYLVIQQRYFVHSVSSKTIISMHQKNDKQNN